MNKKLYILAPAILIVTAITGVLKSNSANELLQNPSVEDTIDLRNSAVEISLGKSEIQLCRTNIKSKVSNKAFWENDDSISVDAFDSLRAHALALGSSLSGHYILALKIRYGLNPMNDKIKLLYQPMYLKRSDSLALKKNAIYTNFGSSPYYRYNYTSAKFEIVTDTSSFARYVSNVAIKHPGSTTYANFHDASDSTGDVKAVIFSFQEIKAVKDDNNCKTIYLQNAATTWSVNATTYLKHILFLTAEDLKDSAHFFKNKYGNLSHLCPPSCDTHKYDLK